MSCYGRIRTQKGTDVFVDSMLEVLLKFPETRALIMGRTTSANEQFKHRLLRTIRQRGLQGRILWLPEVLVNEMAQRYQVLDLYIAPHREGEGFGLTPLESLSCGVPVIATTVGAFPDMIQDGCTGKLVAPGDTDAMISAISRALADDSMLNAWGSAARRHVCARFGIENEVNLLNSFYTDLLEERALHRTF